MSKKFNKEEREKLAQELIRGDLNISFDSLGPAKKSRKLLKTPLEKIKNYHLIIEASVFWASREAYLELIKSFLSKKIDGETLTSKFFKLRSQDMMRTDELCAVIEDRVLPIPDLSYTFKAENFSSAIDELHLEIDRYDPSMNNWDSENIVYSESKLRSVIQERFVPILKKSCDLSDSFF